jgi:RNA polymerase sigma factor FliA
LILSLETRVKAIARRLAGTLPPGRVTLDELVSAGWVGAINAVDAYVPGRGIPLGLFAQHRIRGEMLDYLRSLDHLRRWTRARVNRGEIADIPRPLHLFQSVADSGEELLLIDSLADAQPDPEALLMRREDECRLESLLATLPARRRRVVERRMAGMLDTESAEIEGVNSSRISQIYGDAIQRMKAAATGEGRRGRARLTGEFRHGMAGYSHHGCRCDRCRGAHNAFHREYQREYRRRRRAS